MIVEPFQVAVSNVSPLSSSVIVIEAPIRSAELPPTCVREMLTVSFGLDALPPPSNQS